MVVFTQGNAVIIVCGAGQIFDNALMVITAGELVRRIVARHQHFVQPTQTHHVLADRAVVHLGLLKQILFEGHNVEIARVAVAGNLAAKTA
ncbi:hypothetical protein D3C79_979140 [compost metagenome]